MSSDVCLILEGTYPYVSGGVSTWVHNLIRDLSDLKFSIVYLGASVDTHREFKYSLPRNVTDLREVFLQGAVPAPPWPPRHPWKDADWDRLRAFLDGLRRQDPAPFAPLVQKTFLPGRASLSDFLYGKASWDFMIEQYRKLPEEPSFLDYFWSWRFTHIPIWKVLDASLPRARCFHTVSTGYAGLLAAAARVRTDAPMILTEHGIYTRERRMEIAQAEWIFDEEEDLSLTSREAFFKHWWIRMFTGMSRLAYHHADAIVTLYEGNRRTQIEEGASPEKIRIVPNGIDVEIYEDLRRSETPATPATVALVGRVVPVKDVKGFLQAAKILCSTRPGTRIRILGPTDEDPGYFQDCEILCRMLGLGGAVEFMGKVALTEHLPSIDCLVLTSVSEGQPLVILEAMACGIPVVATDVGACRELLEGKSEADCALGPAGLLTPIGQPERTAQAVLSILSQENLYRSLSRAGRARAGRFYRSSHLNAHYQALYEQLPLLARLKRPLA